ncbi:MFS transporter [Mangrovactinospora gilvigrisea]|uniref:MFS transporter n=1 Tax=Mangrovactinospora gilvigrisea TaxID=1428644 RepID=A0A1J7BRY1_9ACTN|nr:MFS transporter [Mangrovactinospora gilvigrisea]OIV36217.1 MFS transporter [Mangrovactinospora gilvigrisea]
MSSASGDAARPRTPATNDETTTTDKPADPAARPPRGGMFGSLRVRNYRLFFMGSMVSNTGTWMQRVAQDWLVLQITNSSTAVGITTALQFLPMLLFGLYGGVIADRCNKRMLLLITQASMGLVGAGLAVVTLAGQVHVWHVYLAATLLGLITVLDNPARQTFVSEMVGQGAIRNAVSLNAANFQTARMIGPAVAGIVMGAAGAGWAMAVNAISFVGPLTGLLLMHSRDLQPGPKASRGKGQLREGMSYVRQHPELIWPIVLVGFIGTFGFNFPVILPAFASKVFHTGATQFGLLNTAMAIGSLVGALLAARRRTSRMRMVVFTAVAFGALEALSALSPSYWIFFAVLIVVGALGLSTNTMSNQTVQIGADPAMRGRVMGLYMLVFAGGTPIGSPIIGWVTETWGARVGLAVCGLISLLAAATIGMILARVAGLRLKVQLGNGGRIVALVPREGAERSDRVAAAF